jgi:hypothetical protein
VCRPANQAGATPWSCEGDHRSAGIVHTMPVASRNQPGARWIMSDAFQMERRCSTPWGVTPAFGRHVRRPLGPHAMTPAAAGAERPSALQNRMFRHPMVRTRGEPVKRSIRFRVMQSVRMCPGRRVSTPPWETGHALAHQIGQSVDLV